MLLIENVCASWFWVCLYLVPIPGTFKSEFGIELASHVIQLGEISIENGEAGWEQRVSEIHRWLVHTLGEDLLVPREEEE